MSSSCEFTLQGPLKALFESGLLGAVISTSDGDVLAANRGFLKMTGFSLDDLRAMGIGDFNPEWEEGKRSRLRILRGECESYCAEKGLVRKDGTTIRTHVTCTLIGTEPPLFMTFVEELATRDALHESEEYLKAIFDHSMDAMLLFNDEGRYIKVNRAAEQIFGKTAEELTNSLVGSLGDHGADPLRVIAELHAARSLRLELTVRHPDGSIREVESLFTASVMQGTHLCVARDVTDRKSLERQLQQAQKMEAVGRLAGGVAHDINNMLTVIRGYSEIMKRKMVDSAPLQRYADMIIAASDRSSNITQQLLAFSRQQVLQPTILDVRTVVGDVIKLLTNLLGEDISITTSLAAETGAIRADAGQMGQLVMNLAVNARDAMPNGGALHVATRKEVLSGTPEGAVIPIDPGTYAVLSVGDNGCGIESFLLSHIFEPFFTTKEKGKGTGLGLATVYAIVEQSRGTIVTKSEVGVGTTFEIYLPVEQTGAAEISTTLERAGAVSTAQM